MNQLDIYYRALLEFRRQINSSAENKAFSNAITEAVEGGAESIVITRPVCKIDEDWIIAIEEGLEHVEKAIKEDRQFIRSNGEVIPIEKVKNVSKDSVQHLAKHSNLITREPEEGDDIIPDGLYTLERLNDYTVYENRFLYMLLCYLRDFVTLRYNKIQELSTRYEGVLQINKSVVYAKRKLSYTISLHEERNDDRYLRENNESKDIIARISLILNAVLAFLSTPLMESVAKVAMLKPPITKTNVLKMDKNFKGAVALYDFIIAYDKDGYSVEQNETVISPFSGELAHETADIVATAAFLMYEYGLDMTAELKHSYELEEQRRRAAEIAAHGEQLEMIRKKVMKSGVGQDEYILELERHLKQLESETSKMSGLYSRIDALKMNEAELNASIASLNGRIGELEGELGVIDEKHMQDIAAVKSDCDGRIYDLVSKHNAEIENINSEMSQLRHDCRQQIEDIKNETDAKRKECDSFMEEFHRQEERNLLLEAQLKALRAQNGMMGAEDDYSERESFTRLEREYEAFTKFYQKQWGNTKKKIRKTVLDPKNIKDQSKK